MQKCPDTTTPIVNPPTPGTPPVTSPLTLRPSTAVLTQWTTQFPASGVHNDKLVETTSDNDSTYLEATNDNLWDTFTVKPTGIPTGSTIQSVVVHVQARYTTSGTNNIVAPGLISAGKKVWADRQITSSYADHIGTWSTDPATGLAWTIPAIDALNFGVRKSYSGAVVRVTQVYLVVNFTGPSQQVNLRPNGVGSSTSWALQSPTTGAHWDKVSEVTADDDKTYVQATNDALWDLYTHQAIGLTSSSKVQYIQVCVRAKYNISGTNNIVAPGLKSGTKSVWADKTITTSYGDYCGQWSTDPNTGVAWANAAIDAAQFGVRKSYTGSEVRVTQVYAVVTYTP